MDRIDDCDALVIACPDRFHHRYVMAGLERGLPILAEKPLTVELADASEIVDTEVALGRRLIQLGFMRSTTNAISRSRLRSTVSALRSTSVVSTATRTTARAPCPRCWSSRSSTTSTPCGGSGPMRSSRLRRRSSTVVQALG